MFLLSTITKSPLSTFLPPISALLREFPSALKAKMLFLFGKDNGKVTTVGSIQTTSLVPKSDGKVGTILINIQGIAEIDTTSAETNKPILTIKKDAPEFPGIATKIQFTIDGKTTTMSVKGDVSLFTSPLPAGTKVGSLTLTDATWLWKVSGKELVMPEGLGNEISIIFDGKPIGKFSGFETLSAGHEIGKDTMIQGMKELLEKEDARKAAAGTCYRCLPEDHVNPLNGKIGGTLAYNNNNPHNLKWDGWRVAYLKSFGIEPLGADGKDCWAQSAVCGHMIFKTEEQGILAGQHDWEARLTGKHELMAKASYFSKNNIKYNPTTIDQVTLGQLMGSYCTGCDSPSHHYWQVYRRFTSNPENGDKPYGPDTPLSQVKYSELRKAVITMEGWQGPLSRRAASK